MASWFPLKASKPKYSLSGENKSCSTPECFIGFFAVFLFLDEDIRG
jgi:hypothetical protein